MTVAEYRTNGVKIGLILPRLFEFSETVKIMTFSYTVFQDGGPLHRHVVCQVAQYGGRGQPTASERRALKKLSDLNACEN